MDNNETANFGKELSALLNKYSIDARTSTPDYILAQHLMWCIAAYERTTHLREEWFSKVRQENLTREHENEAREMAVGGTD